MAVIQNNVENAHRRISILKAIIRSERARAEAQPTNQRNIDLAIVEADESIKEARESIRLVFNELELLLDHLHVAHLAASFEMEAFPRLGKIIGDARANLKKQHPVAKNLIRELASFEGLSDIEKVLPLAAATGETFGRIRRARNRFSHGVKLNAPPDVDSGEALDTLRFMLEALKARKDPSASS